jgi:cell division protein YceG involved in septum cleavage
MEMIGVVFFFLLCAGICTRIFIKADLISREAADLNRAVLIAQSSGEVYKERGMEGLKETFSLQKEEKAYSYLMKFDKNGESITSGEAVFTAEAELQEDDEIILAIKKGEKVLYNLTIKRHENGN